MLPLVEFPELVEHYAPFFTDVFSAEALIEFKRYISGLIVSENKTIEGINRLFVSESRNQSSLNRLLTQSPFSLEELNKARMNVLASQPETQLKRDGVLGLDDSLLIHYGQEFEQIANLFDHVTGTYVWAHDLVTLHYSDDETDYPEPRKWRAYLLGVWQRQQKKEPDLQKLYETKLSIAQQLIQEWQTAHPDYHLPVTFDSWFTQPAFCQFLDKTLKMAYVGTLAETDKVNLKSGQITLGEFAKKLKEEHLVAMKTGGKPVFQKNTIRYKGEKEVYYSYCQTHQIHTFSKQRLVINYRKADLSDNPTFFISNRLFWQANGITRIRRHRWPVEVYHEEGKAEGLDQYQLREFSAIQRHVALVAVVYSLLRTAQHDPSLHLKLQRQLKVNLDGSPAAWRRATQAQCLWSLAVFISTGLSQGQNLQQIIGPLIRTICRA